MDHTATRRSPRRRSGTQHWTIDEWFVVVLARTVHDREVVLPGFTGPCAQVAAHVALRTHARDSLLIDGVTGAVGTRPAYRMRLEEIVDAAARGSVDRLLLGVERVDGFGNAVARGGGLSAAVGAVTVWTTRHRAGRTLVPRVHPPTDPGHVTAEGPREGRLREGGPQGGGPQWLVTELGIFDFAPDGHARLRARFPDVTTDAVADATGFALRVDLAPGLLHPPSGAELSAVRSVDPHGVRRREFSPAELSRHFTTDTGAGCAC